MTAFPIASNLAAARAENVLKARTEEEAATHVGGPVFLAVEEWPTGFATPAEAEAAAPDLYGGGLHELLWRDGAWRIATRYWRPAPPAPVARNAEAAAKRPLGRARTPEEARVVLGAPAELAQDVLPRLYANHSQLMRRWGDAVKNGLADIVEREGKFAVSLTYWRAVTAPGAAAPLAPAERTEIAERIQAPMRGSLPQSPLDIGLFERPAPENPDIILAEEGDGRRNDE